MGARGRTPYSSFLEPRPARENLLRLWWRQRWLIAAVLAAAGIVWLTYLRLAPRIYTAEARIYVQRGAPGLSIEQRRDDIGRNFLHTQAELIRSTPVVALVLGMPGVEQMRSFDGVSNKIAHLKRQIRVAVGQTNDFITVRLDSPDRDEAVRMVDRLVESYREFQASQHRENAADVVELLQRERQRREEELATKSHAMIALQEQAGTISFDNDRGNVVLQRLQSISDALTTAQMETFEARSAYDRALAAIQLKPELIEQIDQHTVALSATEEELLRGELVTLQQRLNERLRRYGANHPHVADLRARVEQLRVSFAGATKQRWLAAVRKQADLQASFDAQEQLALRSSALALEHARAEADVHRLEAAIRELDAKIKEVGLAASGAALNITVVDPAQADATPSSPRPMLAGAYALGAGLLLALALAIGREWIDPRLRSSDDVRRAVGMPVLGLIPHVPRLPSDEAHGWLVHLDPGSAAAEGYRSVRMALQFGAPAGESRQIVVTSPSPRDGRSALASNLAIAIAKSGRRVLLLDADFRSPAQHRIFGVSDNVGFSTALLTGALAAGAIRRTTIEHLHVMPAGPVPSNLTEMLNSHVLGDLLEKLGQQFDHVVIDSPPVLGSDDARIVAASCDLSLLVVRAGRSNAKLAAAARDALLTVGARIFGVVLNDASPAAAGPVMPPASLYPVREDLGLTPGQRRTLTTAHKQ